MTRAGAADLTRAQLEDEREFLVRSLRDLEDERAVGDLSPEDYATLQDRYTARTAEVLHALDAIAPSPPAAAVTEGSEPRLPARVRRRRRRLLVATGTAAFALLALVAVASATGMRLPGEASSGSPTLGRSQQVQRQLAQAASLEQEGRAADALALYRTVLGEDPTQSQALAESGWLEF
ncbi:MAG TPA: hypothetical protein VEI83_08640, partial [Acidimicrobiales bacterium]|nr:hypothetical protein [Acidimicrobiales bacterium]